MKKPIEVFRAKMVLNALLVAAFPVLAWLQSGWREKAVALLITLVAWSFLTVVAFAQYRRDLGKPLSIDRYIMPE